MVSEKIMVWVQPTKWFQRRLLLGFNSQSGFREDYGLDSTNQVVSEKIVVWIQQPKLFQRRLWFGFNQPSGFIEDYCLGLLPSGFREDHCLDSTNQVVSEKIIKEF